MISKKMQAALNGQINAESFSAYLYLAMSAQMSEKNLSGMANWFKIQAQEELVHATLFFNYMAERGGRVRLEAIEKPESEWSTPLAAFEAAYGHELKISKRINDLVDLALEERDHASNAFLQWFINEQVEEEAAADGIVQKLKLAGENGNGLFMIDRELATRVFALPAGITL